MIMRPGSTWGMDIFAAFYVNKIQVIRNKKRIFLKQPQRVTNVAIMG